MILEANRIIADALSDPLYGVNALLASTPRDAGDPQPADIASIAEETSDSDVARGDFPATLPAIAVQVDVIKDLDGQVQTITKDGQLKLRIRVCAENPATAEGVRDTSYYLRTIQRSLRQFLSLPADDEARERNDIYLETCLTMDVAIAWTKTQGDGAYVTGYVLPTIQLRDLAP